MNPDQETLSGRVSRIRFQNAELTFTIGSIETSPGEHQTFKYFGAVMQGDTVNLIGKWEQDAKWGPQFSAKSVTFDLPIDPEGLMRYLIECPAFKGIGMSKAAALVTNLGAEEFSRKVIEMTPEELAAAGRLPVEIAEAFKIEWVKRSAVNELSTQLAAYELTDHQIKKVIEALGSEALPILKLNPYKLTEVDGFGFKTVDKIALRVGIEKTDKRRLGAGLTAALGLTLSQGHTYSSRSALKGDASEILCLDGTPDEVMGLIEGAIDAEVELGNLVEDEESRISLQWVKGAERVIAEQIAAMKEVEPLLNYPPHDIIEYVKSIEAFAPIWEQANTQQRVAVFAALRQLCLVITGVAGTGKTTVVKLIIAALEVAGIGSIALCAPTGKAARRLSIVTGRPTQTVHRLIGAGSKGYSVDQIDAQAIIIDEASMLDVLLFSALIRRIRYRTHLILVGDINQLPPVGAGYPLRDIIKQKLCPVAELTEVVRQAGRLQKNSLEILNGTVADNDPTSAEKSWYLIKTKTKSSDEAEQRSDAEIGGDALVALFDTEQISRLGYHQLYQTQIVTAQAPGALGTERLNARLQQVFQKKRGVIVPPAPEGEKAEKPAFFVGDKVIFTKNDYDRGLMNGDVGVIRLIEYSKIGTVKDIVISWDSDSDEDDHRLVTVPRGSLSDLFLAYALTVHKAQGSEYPCCVVVAAKSHGHIHKNAGRNWLYTAVTRAAKTCLIVGDTWGIRNAAAHIAEDKRRTWLSLPLDNLVRSPEEIAEEETKKGLADISRQKFIDLLIEKLKALDEWSEHPTAPVVTGNNYIYLMAANVEGMRMLKIGRSQDPKQRAKQIEGQLPIKVELLHYHKGPASEETELHERFSSLRYRKEWFRYNESIIAYFRSKV